MKKRTPADNSFIKTDTGMGRAAAAVAKKAVFAAIAILLGLALLEIVSCAVLLIRFRQEPAAKFLLSKFPAQLRVRRREAAKAVFFRTPLEKVRDRDLVSAFNFDPAMGFRDEKYMKKLGPPDADFTICCLGGSTTAGDMWPAYLEKYAKAEKISEKISVLNAGVPGYMSSSQQIYLTNWVMGKAGNKCDAVVSLDGVNDVHFRIAAYFYALDHGMQWTPAYHAFQEKMEHDVKSLQTVPGAAANLGNRIVIAVGGSWDIFAITIPYTTRLIFDISAAAGEKKKAALIEKRRRAFRFTVNNELVLPPDVEDKIVHAWESNAVDLAGACRARGIPFVSYLQPVLLERYYPAFAAANRGIPNYANETPFTIGHDLGGDLPIDVRLTYLKAEGLYSALQGAYPENFGSLIFLFKDNPNPRLYVDRDTVHYSQAGSELIARAVIKDLIARNILHRAGK